MVKTLMRFFLLMLLASLGACAAGSEYADDSQYNAGYSDGCASASSASGSNRAIPSRIARDERAYKSDKAYRAGWNAGYHACGRAYDDNFGGGPNWP